MNAKISTGSELIGTSEYVPFNICMIMFLGAQGHEIKKKILFQDNQSTTSMANNGRCSCTENSRHINVLHFFVKDRVEKGEIEVKYFPTHIMIPDYYTIPLEGKMFKCFVM